MLIKWQLAQPLQSKKQLNHLHSATSEERNDEIASLKTSSANSKFPAREHPPSMRSQTMRRQRATTAKHVSSAAEENSREAFQATFSLYATLYKRSCHNPWYLARNLRRDYPRPSATHNFPVVKYVSDEPGVQWYKQLPNLQCLWCTHSIPRFWNSTELLHHLRTCHGMLAYTLHVASNRNAPVIVSIRLLRGEEGALAAKIDRFHTYDLEEVYVNTKRYPHYLRSRPSARTRETDPSFEPPTKDVKTRRTASKKKRKSLGKPAFRSVRQAAEDGVLYHSNLAVPLSVKDYEHGADSDNDETEEHLWRLQLVDTEIEEFIDTIPVEKLFMILWNQFVRMEFLVQADRHVGPACMCFVKKYRKTLIRLNLEATFLRHMTELGRRGLVDADAIFDTLKVLENRDVSKRPGEEEPRFLFAERFLNQEDRRQLLEKRKQKEEDAKRDAMDAS